MKQMKSNSRLHWVKPLELCLLPLRYHKHDLVCIPSSVCRYQMGKFQYKNTSLCSTKSPLFKFNYYKQRWDESFWVWILEHIRLGKSFFFLIFYVLLNNLRRKVYRDPSVFILRLWKLWIIFRGKELGSTLRSIICICLAFNQVLSFPQC